MSREVPDLSTGEYVLQPGKPVGERQVARPVELRLVVEPDWPPNRSTNAATSAEYGARKVPPGSPNWAVAGGTRLLENKPSQSKRRKSPSPAFFTAIKPWKMAQDFIESPTITHYFTGPLPSNLVEHMKLYTTNITYTLVFGI